MKFSHSLLLSSLFFSTAVWANLPPVSPQSAPQAVEQASNAAKSALNEKAAKLATQANEQKAKLDAAKVAVSDKTANMAVQANEQKAKLEAAKTAVGEKATSLKNQVGEPKTTAATKSASTGKININTADLATLQSLNGIGEVKAKAIIAYREKYGAFKNAEALMQVPGIGAATLDNIKSNLRFK